MQTEAANNTNDTQHLLHDKDSSNSQRRWSTIQLVFIVILAIIISALATNMDRIVDAISDSKDSSSNEPSSNYEFGHSARDLFALDEDYTEFNFGAYGMLHTHCNYKA